MRAALEHPLKVRKQEFENFEGKMLLEGQESQGMWSLESTVH